MQLISTQVPKDVLNIFYILKKSGNDTAHDITYEPTKEDALLTLKLLFKLSLWFHNNYNYRGKVIRNLEYTTPTPSTAKPSDSEIESEIQPATKQEQIYIKNHKDLTLNLNLKEDETRFIIDQWLQASGWEADTKKLRYSKGARPKKGRNLAISEYPTVGKNSADYILFKGLTPIAVVEAKRKNKNVSAHLSQAENYSKEFTTTISLENAYGEHKEYKIPFVYSCNGRPYNTTILDLSGIWFRDVRSSTNHKKALEEFHTPKILSKRLEQNKESSYKQLDKESFNFPSFTLYPHQKEAIKAIETAIKSNQEKILVAMATGTGKTRTALALIYRLLNTDTYRNILFLVDRNALGQNAYDDFTNSKLNGTNALNGIFELANFNEREFNKNANVQIATVQSMVQKLYSEKHDLEVGAFDCIIIDECHRGYVLDKEQAPIEILYKDEKEYRSKYKHLIDYFDATKIGLTATL